MKKIESMGSGRLRVAHGRHGAEDAVDLGVDGGGDARVAVTQDADGDPVGEVEIGIAVRVEEAVALAVGPRALEVAAQDRGQVVGRERGEVEPRGGWGGRVGRGGARRRVHGATLGFVAGRAGLRRAVADQGRV
jgi:hypothetical protein